MYPMKNILKLVIQWPLLKSCALIAICLLAALLSSTVSFVQAQETTEPLKPLVESRSKGGMLDKTSSHTTTRFERVGSSVIQAKYFSSWEDGVLFKTTVLADGALSVDVDMPIVQDVNQTGLPQAKTAYLTPEEQAALDERLDWYTLFLYDYQSRNLALYDALTVHLVNPNPQPLSVNLVVETSEAAYENDKNNPTSSLNHQSQAIVQPTYLWMSSDHQAVFEVVAMDGNRFEIPAGFSGQLYLPLKSYGAEGKNPFHWSDTIGLSVHFPSQTGEHTFEIDDIQLLRNSLEDTEDFLQTPSLSGNFNLLLPKAGAMLEVYKASNETLATGRPYEFALSEPYAGISIDPRGYLELEASKIDAKEISLQIRDQATGTFSRQMIQLTPLTELNPALAELSVPLSSEIEPFETEGFDGWYRNLTLIRILVGLVVFVMVGLFVYWWETERRYRQENHRQLKAKRGEN